MKKFVFFVALLFASIALQAGELVFHWNKMAESKIYDMEFIPDNDYFVLVTANEFQVRKTEDGEIFKTYPKDESFKQHDIEFSIDSTKIFLSYGEVIEIRNAEDFSIIKTYTMPPAEEGYSQRFLEIKVDPKKPYLYALERQWWVGTPGLGTDRYGICIYNYETMEKVADITPAGFEHKYYENMAISNDGKYLSFINQGESYLVTIDLSTQKELQKFKICNNYSDGGGSGGAPVCIKFSELNSDKIYFSGNFPQSVDDHYTHYGLFVYSISENKIIDSSFGVGNETVYPGYFTFIDKNIEKLVYTNKFNLFILDMNKLLKEVVSETYKISQQILYSKSKDVIIGRGEKHITKLTYKNGSGVVNKTEIYKTIYPNPTNGKINLELNCTSDKNNYELCDSNGLLIKSATIDNNLSVLQIDLSSYPNAVYYIKVICGLDIQTYKIIKES